MYMYMYMLMYIYIYVEYCVLIPCVDFSTNLIEDIAMYMYMYVLFVGSLNYGSC